jgi:hypothetical protein
MAITTSAKSGTRYRRVSTEMYADERFRRLSRQKPSGQSLFIYLLTGPFATLIPGIIVGGAAGIAERLEWSLRAFRKCFGEIADQGMALADWSAPLIFLPNALKHNQPPNPSVIEGWRHRWAEVPACHLKTEAALRIAAGLDQKGSAYRAAFAVFAGLGAPDTHNEDHQAPHQPPHDGDREVTQQEQEQEQEYTPQPPSGGRRPRGARTHHPRDQHQLQLTESFDLFWSPYPRKEAKKDAQRAWRVLDPSRELVVSTIVPAVMQKAKSDDWQKENKRFVPLPATYIRGERWNDQAPVLQPVRHVDDAAETSAFLDELRSSR